MDKMNCDIIKDLIPSYVDEVCSDATRQCVEEHIADCDNCRQMVSFYRNHMLSGNKLERKSLDGLKKIKELLRIQRLVCYAVLAALILLGIWIFVANRYFSLFFAQTFLFIVCMFAGLLFGIGSGGKTPLGRREYIFGGISVFLDIYFVLIFLYMSSQLKQDTTTLFGMEPYRVGPFIERQLIVAFAVQIAFFVYNLFCIIRQDKNCSWLLCLNMTGIFLILRYDLWMKYMDDFETLFRSMIRETLEVVIIGLLGIAISLLITKKMKKRNSHTETAENVL